MSQTFTLNNGPTNKVTFFPVFSSCKVLRWDGEHGLRQEVVTLETARELYRELQGQGWTK